MTAKRSLKKVFGVLSVVIIIIETIAILFLVAVKFSGKVPDIFGYNMCVIVTPSMEPDLEVGDLIVSKVYDSEHDELNVGDIVTYNGREGDVAGKLITHGIVKIEYGENGEIEQIVTKGTANYEADSPIAESDIVSVMKYKTVVLGGVYRIISTTWGFFLLVEIPMISLIVDEILGLIGAVKKEGNKIEGEEIHNKDEE